MRRARRRRYEEIPRRHPAAMPPADRPRAVLPGVQFRNVSDADFEAG